jgi:Uma2 family endonuclease
MAEPAVRPAPLTFADVERLDPDLQPGDLVEGVWVPVSKNTWRHGEIVFRISMLLGAWAERSPGWSISVGDPGTKLRRDPDGLRGPDIGIVREERRPTGTGQAGWLEGAPDLAVEVVGDNQSASELMEKALEYLRAGGKTVWVVDPAGQRVILVTPPNQFSILGPGDRLEGAEALPGFACTVKELFPR